MWNRFKQIINSNKHSSPIVDLNSSLHELKTQKSLTVSYHLKAKNQCKQLEEKSETINKHILKNDFDIKAQLEQNSRGKAMQLNEYGNSLKSEIIKYKDIIEQLETEILQFACDISTLDFQIEAISAKIIQIKGHPQEKDFDVKEFLEELSHKLLDNKIYEENDLLEMEINQMLDTSIAKDNSSSKITNFFKEKSSTIEEQTNNNLIDNFFNKKEKTDNDQKIDDFFNKK
ncbi:hypothetical protein [Flammeovirga kamogawensis]|uniref:PspA/IM30 family protein n=1 Tax=Flammeovirga kamogawensis TaxID=373891 RepID=A0ABX8H0U3_9BACT|nr:hypothetical protein [Flammeovirga kamogawensis]MBB6459515.1 hypothetical protein [Flammeovirga kamogawensis]QWG09066.1 hypothetical protein KM029_09010 [Flammeovirga kamogawensis]TRX67354.1 hypothetical protein EO216_04050 [Flammeovirga kamogawensis]